MGTIEPSPGSLTRLLRSYILYAMLIKEYHEGEYFVMILFVNACVRNNSRTLKLARYLLDKLGGADQVHYLSCMEFPVIDEGFLMQRDALIDGKRFNIPEFSIVRDFADADQIVIAAPYWDLSFPASLKQYLEYINVRGITFSYSEEGIPQGLCKAKRLYYVTTAGGNYVPQEYGFGYVKALATGYYGIPDVRLIEAKGLDIYGADPDSIIKECMEKMDTMIL